MKGASRNLWKRAVVEWTEGSTAFLSIPFTWLLPQAWSRAVWFRQEGYSVRAGGPAVALLPDYLRDVAACGGDCVALPRHNREATFSHRGCIRRCPPCAVWRIEPEFVEDDGFIPKRIVCDNNLLACSRRHFDLVIDREKPFKGVDFNQGLDARLLKPYHIDRLRELSLGMVRFAWDDAAEERPVLDAIRKMLAAGFPKSLFHIYVLVNHGESQDEALYRCQTLKNMGIRAWPQRYNPLDTLVKDSYLDPAWTKRPLSRFMWYWSRQNWLNKVPWDDYVKRGIWKRRESFPPKTPLMLSS